MEKDNEENGRGEREDTSTDGKMRPEEENCGNCGTVELWKATVCYGCI
jgi:hypothetical protein